MIAYFAGLRDSVGIHGQALAIERFFSKGVPATLTDAPASGFDGMTTLRNRLLLLDSPQSIEAIRDALLRIYDSEIQQALNQTTQQVQIQPGMQANWGDPIRKLVYPEIASANLDQWRRLVEQPEVGPVKNLYKYKVETVWFGIQELRQQVYGSWAEILHEHGIAPAEAGIAIQNAPEADYRQTPGSTGEEAYGPSATYVNALGLGGGSGIPGSTQDRYPSSAWPTTPQCLQNATTG